MTTTPRDELADRRDRRRLLDAIDQVMAPLTPDEEALLDGPCLTCDGPDALTCPCN